MNVLGIDIGGSGIKGAVVNIEKGILVTDRLRIPTPKPSRPDPVIKIIQKIVKKFDHQGPIGVGFPGVISGGLTLTAANVDDHWIGFPASKSIAKATGCETVIQNDADAAGIAEMAYGAGRGKKGVVMIFTLGTGIGSSMFVNGRLVPNLELGHMYLRNHKKDVEYFTADRVRKMDGLSWKEWGGRLNIYFKYIESLFWPDLIIIGGGVSKKHQRFLPYLDLRAEVVPAELLNEAGIIGAAAVVVHK